MKKKKIYPKNIYGLTKKFNEEIAQNFFEMYKFKSIGLRFLQFLVNGGGLICLF